jgi:pimeloyl-ACP methyl ester carboxylesterase
MAEAARQATLIEIPDAGHLTPLENPVVVTLAMSEWLTDEFGGETQS